MNLFHSYQNTYLDLVALVFLVLLLVFLQQTQSEILSSRRFRLLVRCAAVSVLGDIVWHAAVGFTGVRSIAGAYAYLVTGNLFTAATTYFVLTYITTYFRRAESYERFCITAKRLFAGYLVLLLLSYIPLRFYAKGRNLLPEQLIADRTVITLFFLLPALAIAFAFLQVMRLKEGGSDTRRRGTFLVTLLIMTGSVVLQTVFTELRINYFFLAVSIYLLFLMIETPDYKNLRVALERLTAAEEAAVGANRDKTDFLANMSHEMRTPINTVLGMNEMILRESTDEATLEHAVNIRSAGGTLLDIVDTILDFSKIETGKMEILPVWYDITSTINDLVNTIMPRVKEKDIKLKVDVDERLPHLLFGDEMRIKQIIMNLLSNAAKYTVTGTITFSVGFDKLSNESILLRVRVQDTGIGIKSQDIERLFTAFERMDEEQNRGIEGTGLGLSIVQRLLTMMGSKIEVKSVYGQGSIFSFALEQTVIDWKSIGEFRAGSGTGATGLGETYTELFHAPDARILVVDDTQLNLTVVERLLKYTQVQIDTALSGRDALAKTAQIAYDVIFIDHRMPEMDGLEMLRLLREQGGMNDKTPCIALTANAVVGAREMYLTSGFQDYLAKPVDAGRLERLLLEYLPQKKVVRSSDEAFVPMDKERGDKEAKEREERKEVLNKVSGIDVAAGVAACGDEETLIAAIRDFHATIASQADDIEHFAAEGDWRNYTIKVHALKSSARFIGALWLSKDAAFLEQCGNEENAEVIRERTPALLSLFRSYSQKLAPAVVEEDDTGKEEIAVSELMDAYAAVKELAEAFDFDSADGVMEQLSAYKIPEEEKERYEKVKLMVVNVDRDGLLELL